MKSSIFFLVSFFFCFNSFSQDPIFWRVQTRAGIYSSPSVDERAVYFGSEDSCLYALDKNTGIQNWTYKTNGKVNSSPCIYENNLCFSSMDGFVYSLDKNTGTLRWKFKTGGEKKYDLWDYYLSSPVIENGIVYIGSGDSCVYAIRSDTGLLLWKYKTGGMVHATPVLKNGTVYIGSYDGVFYALNAKDGTPVWKFKTVGDINFPKGEIQKAAAISQNTLFFGSRDYNIYALDLRTGRGQWNMKERGSWILATPFVYQNNLYFGTSDSHHFYCMDKESGEVRWMLPLNMRVYGMASLIGGNIVFGCFNGKLYFTDPETGSVKKIFQTAESELRYLSIYDHSDHFKEDFHYDDNMEESEHKILSLGSILSDILVENERMYFGDANGFFYALKY